MLPLPFTLVQEAVVNPKACVCTHATGPFLDTHLERFGEHIYICQGCVQSTFEAYESVPLDVHKRECARLDETAARVTTLTGELDVAQAKVANVEAANQRLIERVDGLSQERGANETVVANLREELKHARNGTQSIAQAKAAVAKRRPSTPKKDTAK